jgi:cytochrome c-type biogenesis protein CcmF
VAATIVQEYVRGVRARRITNQENVLVAMGNLWSRNGRRYGGYIVHIGVLLVALGIIGNEFYQSEGEANLARGESMTVANYTLTYNRLDMIQGPNYTELIAPMTLSKNGQVIGEILPKKHISQEPGAAHERWPATGPWKMYMWCWPVGIREEQPPRSRCLSTHSCRGCG